MPFLSYRHAVQLRQELKDTRATVVTPEEEDFPELISRWSDTCEKEAVCRQSTPVSPLPALRNFHLPCLCSANIL